MRMLVASDGSERSLEALAHAAHLASAVAAELLLFRVLEPWREFEDEYAAADRPRVQALARRWRAELSGRLAATGANGSVRVAVADETQGTADAILRTAAIARVRMIAMATDGAGRMRRAVLGSVASDVLGRAPVPVMLVGRRVRPPHDARPYRLVLTTDGSAAAATVVPATARLLRGAPADGVELTLLRVFQPAYGDPPTAEALATCRRELAVLRRRAPRRFPVRTDVVAQRALGRVDRAIVAAADREGAHALAMATHGRSFVREVLVGSVALRTVQHAPVPVVLTRATA